MATADLTITSTDVKVLRLDVGETYPAGVAITAGQAIRQVVGTGVWALAQADSAAHGHETRIACNSAITAGLPVTGMKKGIMSLGEAIQDAGTTLTYDDDVYLSNDTAGALADGAKGQNIIVGQVYPGWVGTTPDKLLRVDL